MKTEKENGVIEGGIVHSDEPVNATDALSSGAIVSIDLVNPSDVTQPLPKEVSRGDPHDGISRIHIINVTPGLIAGIEQSEGQPKKHLTNELQGRLNFAENILRQKSNGMVCIGCTIYHGECREIRFC